MTGRYLPGRAVLGQIEAAREGFRHEVASLESQLRQLDERTRDVVAQRGQALVDLAKLYLPTLDSQQTVDLGDSRAMLRDLIAERDRERHELQSRFDVLLDNRQRLKSELDEITARLNALVEQRESLESQLADRLRADDEFRRLSTAAVTVEEELKRFEARVRASREESAKKLPAYEQSRLFKHLVDRKFGTSDYQHRGLTRRLDRWVAKLVKFDKQKKSYDFLRMTPELMAAEVDRRKSDFEALLAQVEQIEQRYSEEIGLTPVLAEGVRVGQERDAKVAEMEEDQRKRHDLEQQPLELNSNDNDFYRSAVERMQKFLGSIRQSALASQARSTPTIDDDQLVGQLAQLSDQLERAAHDSQSIRASQQYATRRLDGLAQLAQQFRAAEYDSGRSLFPADFELRPYLDQYLRGGSSLEAIWSMIASAQAFAPTYVERQGGYGHYRESEFGYVLMRVLGEVAGAVIRESLRGGGGGWSGGGHSPRRSSSPPPSIRRPGGGGFTRGSGF